MPDFKNLEELNELKVRGIIDDAQFNHYRHVISRGIVKNRKELAQTKSGILYLILAFFLGTIGLHNFYAGYFKRGLVQLVLTLSSFALYYLPLLLTAFWALLEFLMVNHSANGIRFRGKMSLIWGLRIIALLFFCYVYFRSKRSLYEFYF